MTQNDRQEGDREEHDIAEEARRQMLESAQVITLTQHIAGNIAKAAQACVHSIKSGGTIMICGNGGSAADAQHIAAELINKYRKDRRPLPGLALTTDSSNLTSIGNDYAYDLVFSKQIDALGKKGDVLIAISTSGQSENVIKAIESAKKKGMTVIGLTGMTGGKMRDIVDVLINIPSNDTPRIQEAQHVAYHILSLIHI